MSIQRLFLLLFVLLLANLLGLLGTIGSLFGNEINATRSELRQQHSERLADEFRQSSDDLTQMARLYVVTGNLRYRKHFEEILAIRNGQSPRPERYDLVYWDLVRPNDSRPRPYGKAVSLEARMVEEGFSVAEFNKLREAQNRSDALAKIEAVAMNALVGRFDDGSGKFLKKGPPNRQMAIDLMFNDDYMAYKADIMKPVNEFMMMVEERTAREVQGYISLRYRLSILAFLLGLSGVYLAASTLFMLRKRVIYPLSLAVNSARAVAEGDLNQTISYQSRDEIGLFVATFNGMLRRVQDMLTGLQMANGALMTSSDELRREKERSEELLLNILPASIAARLKNGESHIADEFQEATVLFADLVQFAHISETVGPYQTIRILNDIFALFDAEAVRCGVEKIKIIGDCYVAACGIPDPVNNHAQRMADFALGIRDALRDYQSTENHNLAVEKIQVRIGIHSGSAMAGIVGNKRYSYEIWGDIVTVANSMEAAGEPSQIRVSEATMIRLRDLYQFEPTGEVEIKGQGRVRTWTLQERNFVKTG